MVPGWVPRLLAPRVPTGPLAPTPGPGATHIAAGSRRPWVQTPGPRKDTGEGRRPKDVVVPDSVVRVDGVVGVVAVGRTVGRVLVPVGPPNATRLYPSRPAPPLLDPGPAPPRPRTSTAGAGRHTSVVAVVGGVLILVAVGEGPNGHSHRSPPTPPRPPVTSGPALLTPEGTGSDVPCLQQ